MKTLYALLFAVAGVPLAASAQPPAPPTYRSALTGYQSTPDTTQSPDQVWREANRIVAGTGHVMGHMGRMGNMGNMDHGAMAQDHKRQDAADHSTMDHSTPDHANMPHGAAPAAGPAAVPPARNRHSGHGKHAKPATPQHERKDH